MLTGDVLSSPVGQVRASGWERTHIIAQVAVSQSLHIRDKFTQVLLFLFLPSASAPPSLFSPSVVTGKSQNPASYKGPKMLHLTNSGVFNDVGECVNGVELTPEVRWRAGTAIPWGPVITG